MRSFTAAMTVGLVIGLTAGCGGPTLEFAEVTGKVSDRDGKPLPGIYVRFLPDPSEDEGVQSARASFATTDENGEFTLTYEGQQAQPGAVIGAHRVTLSDAVAEENAATGKPPNDRIPSAYARAADTPLKFEVKAGPNNFPIEVK